MMQFDITWEPLETHAIDRAELSLRGELGALKSRHFLSIGGLGLAMSSPIVWLFSDWTAALCVFSLGMFFISSAAIVTPPPSAKRNDNWR